MISTTDISLDVKRVSVGGIDLSTEAGKVSNTTRVQSEASC